MALIPVGPWSPDDPDFQSDGVITATNVVPKVRSYGPFPDFQSATGSATARIQGFAAFRATSGSFAAFAGDATKLYQINLTTSALTDVSRLAGGAYNTPAGGTWQFTQFIDSSNNNYVIAANGVDAPQKFNIDSAANFSLLAASAPIGTYLATVKRFCFMGNISGFPNTIQWSPIDNPTGTWGTDVTTQADFQGFADSGQIQGIGGADSLIIIQQEGIKRGDYVGPNSVWDFSEIAHDVGATIAGSCAFWGPLAFFVHRSGFYMIQAGQTIQPIGDQRVNKFFWEDPVFGIDASQVSRVTAAIDPVNSLYIIFYRAQNNWAMLGYSWTLDRWVYIQPSMDLEGVWSGIAQSSYTLDTVDNYLGGMYNLDTFPFTLDSDFLVGTPRPLLTGANTTHNIGYFNGSNLAATVDTTETQIFDGVRAFVRRLRPVVSGGTGVAVTGTPTVALGTRNLQTDIVTFGTPVSADASGRCAFRSNARYHRARIQMPYGWTGAHIQGIDSIEAVKAGWR